MKVPVFYCYPYSVARKAEFRIRFDGVVFEFHCERLNKYRRRIRKARALLIRETVITAQPSQYWQINKRRTHWTFQAFNRPRPVPAREVYWALSNDRNLIETYEGGNITRWKIIRTLRQCYLCDALYDQKTKPYWYDYSGRFRVNIWAAICKECRNKLKKHESKRNISNADGSWRTWWRKWSDLTTRDEIEAIASRDRSFHLRWLRNFIADGSFTPSEFKELCNRYGNLCLRCKKKRFLVADHVIPLAAGGGGYITNIQPLCKACNGKKGTKSTDYRKRWHPK